ncbi:two-component system nitrogen regulation response regulator GlnG [Rhodoligotrophos appendicifer]|uniref:nitrogen regulation protein NR(I) n=1 Tax=Rhodoligotrophos appendicifer TaxID=987056 RepID=UPI001184AA4C|nr:nitrogen regulation protein NR(I) [Rhodoligotrophos appendicifer]
MAVKTVLLADDDTAIRTVLNQALGRAGYIVRSTGNVATLWRWVAEGQGDMVVSDVMLPDGNAFDLLPRIKKLRPEMPVVMMSAKNTIMTAITAAERGAYEYLPKPFDLNELLSVVGRALDQSKRKTVMIDPGAAAEKLPIIGRSQAMQEIYRIIARLTQTDLTVMIMGESGTGKELVARALHDYGRRRKGPFVAVNMAAIPRELIESDLFGHEKGAFTGAMTRYAGRFEQAQGGTLFLDEIGDMPMEAQTRLLRVLQQGEFTTVGGTTAIKVNVRIIAATHRDLRNQIAQGLFREDLYFRLNVVPVRLPPLRERLEDIPDLVQHFLTTAEQQGLPAKQIEPEAVERLKAHRWPGNIRELENLMRRISAIYVDEEITARIVNQELLDGAEPQTASHMRDAASLPEYVENHLSGYFAGFGNALPPPGLYNRFLAEVETPLISASLAATNGNQIRAAELLGINRNTLRKKIRDYGITVIRAPSVR